MSEVAAQHSRLPLVLLAMALGVFVIAQDFSAMNVSLPAIEREFRIDFDDAQWIINSYVLVFSMVVVAGGRLADAFGRRRIFFLGSTIFASTSLLGGFAPNAVYLIAFRALMGFGGALSWPAILGMAYTSVSKTKAGLAGGVVIGAAGIGQVAGPVLGGALTQLLSWRWILWVNIPIVGISVAASWLEEKNSKRSGRKAIDLEGTASLALGLFALLLALDQATDVGWTSTSTLTALALACVMLTIFVLLEKRGGPNALIPIEDIRNKQLSAACVITGLGAPAFFATLLILPQFLQKALGYSPLQAGISMAPMMVTFAALSFVAGPLYDRMGARFSVSAGAMCLTIGMLLFSRIGVETPYWDLIMTMIITGFGFAVFLSSVTTAGASAVARRESSLAGGLVYMFRIAGGSIGLGVVTAIVSSVSVSQALNGSLALSGGASFVYGIQAGYLFSGVLAAAALFIALTLLPSGTADRDLAEEG